MKIFLTAINAKYIHSNLAVYSLRAYAKDYQDQIVIGEYTINNRVDYILEQIYKAKPDVLCFSCYIWNMDYVEELITEYHKLCPEVPIWVGGPEVSYEVETFLAEHPQVTGVMIGEGERTFQQLCKYYVNQTDSLEEIRGIAFRDQDSGKTVFTPAQEPMNMSDIPFCYDHIENFENRIIYYESSRGCPFNCSYCLSSIDKKLRFRDIELVKKELAFFIEKKVPQVKFVDRTFNCRHDHALCGLSPEFTLDTMVVERYDRVCSFDPPSGDYLGAGKFKMCIPAFIGFCRSRCFYFLFGTLFIVNTGGKREDKPFRTD